jgi:methyl-accepting chemotaxis protein
VAGAELEPLLRPLRLQARQACRAAAGADHQLTLVEEAVAGATAAVASGVAQRGAVLQGVADIEARTRETRSAVSTIARTVQGQATAAAHLSERADELSRFAERTRASAETLELERLLARFSFVPRPVPHARLAGP